MGDAKSKNTSSNIDIFLRIRPTSKPSNRLLIDAEERKLEFNIPRDVAAGLINNQREHYEFKFNGILTAEAKQDEVFERVARPVVSAAIEGFNGTIFAYGQTGSGKTFTITGGPERYVDRGIIPRSISCIFTELNKQTAYTFQVHISYLELYNETGYDLLDPEREVKGMEDLPQVYIMEDDDGKTHFRNLAVHRATSEEEALNLLFLGDTNRTISETPMNQASSRSHCIFTIHLEARKAGEDTVRRSKLHLVDLAGSERVSKTGIDGTILKEAKYINLSLHYLEQVIIALQERSMGMSRPHIPYRNSIMTMVLKDSLGGNCRTVMVATINSLLEQLDESISTCRFAQRVAMVRNEVMVNEETDPTAVIRRLKQELREVKEELRMMTGEEERGPLTADELTRLQQQIESYCSSTAPDAALNLGGSMMLIRAGFEICKRLIQQGGILKAKPLPPDPGAPPEQLQPGKLDGPEDMRQQVQKLRLQVQQRDNEINILVSMLRRREASGAGPVLPPSDPAGSSASDGQLSANIGPAAGAADARLSSSLHASTSGSSNGGGTAAASRTADPGCLLSAELLADRNKAFEHFRKSYRQNEVIEENKALLKQKYDAAKALGQQVNASKQRINELKAHIEQRRVQRSMSEPATPPEQLAPDPEEERAKAAIEQEKTSYKGAFDQLRSLKQEIEHLQLLLEQSRQRLQRDFQQWMALMAQQQQQQQGAVPHSPQGVSAADHSGGSTSISTSMKPGQLSYNGAQLQAKGQTSALGPPSPSVQYSGNHGSIRSSVDVASPSGRQHPPPPKQAWGPNTPSLPDTPSVRSERPPSRASSISTSSSTLSGMGYAQSVPPAVLAAAQPFLTGNPQADADIIKFYEARAKLLQKMSQQ